MEEIKLMLQIAEKLEEWVKNEPDNKILPNNKLLSEIGYNFSIIEATEGFDKVLMWLQWHQPDMAKSIKSDYDHLLQLAVSAGNAKQKQSNGLLSALANGNDSFLILQDAQVEAVNLAKKLQDIAQRAKKERKRRIVKGIFYLIGVLAALFTCIGYLLGWFWSN